MSELQILNNQLNEKFDPIETKKARRIWSYFCIIGIIGLPSLLAGIFLVRLLNPDILIEPHVSAFIIGASMFLIIWFFIGVREMQ